MTRTSTRRPVFFDSIWVSLCISIFVLMVCSTSPVHAHEDSQPLWAMDNQDLAKLELTIANHRLSLLNALNDAIEVGASAADAQRPYRFDSNREVVDIPRSVLTRVIMASLELETASMKMYLSCEAGCEHSLAKDLAGTPGHAEAIGIIRGLWPKMKASFALLWRDIPVGVWMRTINAARYSRFVFAHARYESGAYGRLSMAMGTAAFGSAFATTEIFESMFMGPLHLVCKANYFWSVAFGAAVAGLSRDLKTLLLFESDGKSLAKRMMQSFSNFATAKNARVVEKRILLKTFAGDALELTKISRRDALTNVLEPMLEQISARQAVAADALLWSELANYGLERHTSKKFRFPSEDREKIFEGELEKVFDSTLTADEARVRWQDISASMRVLLRILRDGQTVAHQLHRDRGPRLQLLGRLDMQLRAIDLFNISWLEKRAVGKNADESAMSAKWLRDIVSEWMALAIETTSRDADLSAVELRRNNLKAILEASIRRGGPIAVTPEGPRDLRSVVQRELNHRTCEILFAFSEI